jgi:hypothetical protein
MVMSAQLKRQVAYGGVLVACLLGVWLTREWSVAQSVLAAGAVAVLAVYVVRADEVERALGLQAAAAAFVLLLAAAIVLKVTGGEIAADALWAIMLGTVLLCWIALRIRLG